ncbi:hypothetical protein CYMTET_23010 [Cymbomonas tetramitiformis]|uniref:Uncharacterized protein n=1 Tax=Cymbomonas tetramitiformis TaxID=36881 RepID=A0AAE0G087_9CHLO|nr:hypothetical protein CYMTET_23010 [Cymbomonas tetramitiformis]
MAHWRVALGPRLRTRRGQGGSPTVPTQARTLAETDGVLLSGRHELPLVAVKLHSLQRAQVWSAYDSTSPLQRLRQLLLKSGLRVPLQHPWQPPPLRDLRVPSQPPPKPGR